MENDPFIFIPRTQSPIVGQGDKIVPAVIGRYHKLLVQPHSISKQLFPLPVIPLGKPWICHLGAGCPVHLFRKELLHEILIQHRTGITNTWPGKGPDFRFIFLSGLFCLLPSLNDFSFIAADFTFFSGYGSFPLLHLQKELFVFLIYTVAGFPCLPGLFL